MQNPFELIIDEVLYFIYLYIFGYVHCFSVFLSFSVSSVYLDNKTKRTAVRFFIYSEGEGD